MNCDLWRSMAEFLLVGRNLVSGICKTKLKPLKNLKNWKPKNLIFK